MRNTSMANENADSEVRVLNNLFILLTFFEFAILHKQIHLYIERRKLQDLLNMSLTKDLFRSLERCLATLKIIRIFTALSP